MKDIGAKVMSAIALGLNLEENYFKKIFEWPKKRFKTIFQLFYY